MKAHFTQVQWNEDIAAVARTLINLAIAEDFGDGEDWTTTLLVPADATASARIVCREAGVLAGLPVVPLVVEARQADINIEQVAGDGDELAPGDTVARLEGNARDLLSSERIALNFLGRLSGIASLTRQFVNAVSGTQAQIYDTRKTTPGWRLLEKYAVRQGGGWNHRLGLDKAVMIKDNHIALARDEGLTLPASIERVRKSLAEAGESYGASRIEAIEVEVDSIGQFHKVLPAEPDIVLLDNMTTEQLAEAVQLRDKQAPAVVLEASGGVTIESVGAIAETGVDRISSGALTHSAPSLDLGLDWGK